MSKKARVTRSHDPEFRKQAAKLVIEENVGLTTAAKDLGIPVTTLDAWVRKFRAGIWSLNDVGAADATMKQVGSKATLPSASQKRHDRSNELEAKNRDLEAKLRRMTMERDILKKAMAYCLDVPK